MHWKTWIVSGVLLRDSRYQFETCTAGTCHFDVVSCGQGLQIMPRGAGPAIKLASFWKARFFVAKAESSFHRTPSKCRKPLVIAEGYFWVEVIHNAMWTSLCQNLNSHHWASRLEMFRISFLLSSGWHCLQLFCIFWTSPDFLHVLKPRDFRRS